MKMHRTQRTYTAAEIAEMTELAKDAQKLAAWHSELMLRSADLIDRVAPNDNFWQFGTEESYPVLTPLAELLGSEPTPTAAWKLNANRIREGQLLEAGENPRTWAKSNRAMTLWLNRVECALGER